MRGRGRKAPNPLTRTYESNGPDVKIRGTALHVAEKYQQLARDAQASGDRVTSENYFQHAEHYQRIVAAAQPQHSQTTPAPYGRSEDETASEAPKAAEPREEMEAAGTTATSSQPIVGLDTPQPFIEPLLQPMKIQKPRLAHLNLLRKMMINHAAAFVGLVVAVYAARQALQILMNRLNHQKVVKRIQLHQNHVVRLVLAHLVRLVHNVHVRLVCLLRTHQHQRL